MTIKEVKEHYKDAKIVESHEGVKFKIENMDYILNGVGCSKHCYYYLIMTIYLPNKGFAKIIEYKAKPTQVTVGDKNSTVCDWLKSTFTVDVPNGMEIDRDSIKFKKIEKELPNSWLDFAKDCDIRVLETIGTIERYVALRKLELLRDCYNDGWKADYKNDLQDKHCIHYISSSIQTMVFTDDNAFLNFKTAELRDKFLENFKDIIELAKPLL